MNSKANIAPCLLLDVYKVYRVTHKCFGTFTARAIEPAPGWCGFAILEATEQLTKAGFAVGDYIELTADFYKARAL